jgi:hypothetical protein
MTTRRHSLLLLSAGLATSAVPRVLGAGTAEDDSLQLRLPASISNARGRWLHLGAFHLVITNHSKGRRAEWCDWCSWGWVCPAISIQVGDSSFDFKKAGKVWTRNFPDPFYLDPGDHYLLPVNLLSDDWIQPKDYNPANDVEAVITASYTIKPDKDTEKMKVWTGTMQTEVKLFLDASRSAKRPS